MEEPTILALDIGTKTTGVALYKNSIIFPLKAINHATFDQLLHALVRLIHQHSPSILVIGKPRRGKITKLAQKVATHISRNKNLKILFIPEDRTTLYTTSELIHTELLNNTANLTKAKKKSKSKGTTDTRSAIIILEKALEKLKNNAA